MANGTLAEPAAPAQAQEMEVSFRPRGSRRLRFVRAYRTTFLVIASYLWLALLSRLFGPGYREAHILATHTRNARRIERTILQLQGLFIKVGQLISILTNFLPAALRRPLESLQDQVPPRPPDETRECIERELGTPAEKLFATFEAVPIASASLGQVHRATLPDGTRVAVKVQHADIEAIARIDLKTIRRILGIIRWFVPVQGLDNVYDQIRQMILTELDFVREAAFMDRIRENLASEPLVAVPEVYEKYSSARVLTLGYREGVKITDVATLDSWKIDRTELARRLVRTYCKMIFVDGVYHADPHPGNVLVQRDGTLVLLDFGAVGELSPSMRRGIPDFLEAVIKRDTVGIYRSMRTMGFIAHGTEAEAAAERIVEYFHRRFQDHVRLDGLNLKDIKVDPQKSLERLLDLQRQEIGIRELTSAFQVPKDWVMLERTLLLIGGVCTTLDPNMNPMGVIRPYLEEFVLGKDRDFTSLLVNVVRDTAMSALAVPDDLRKYIGRAMRGELEMRFRGVREGSNLLYAVGHQMIYAAAALGSVGVAIYFDLRGDPDATRASLGVACFFGLCVLGSMFFARRWRRR